MPWLVGRDSDAAGVERAEKCGDEIDARRVGKHDALADKAPPLKLRGNRARGNRAARRSLSPGANACQRIAPPETGVVCALEYKLESRIGAECSRPVRSYAAGHLF